LITNAIDSMVAKQGARVLCVRSEGDDGGNVILSVAGTGTGIDSQGLGRIFNPLVTTEAGGMGMGLSIYRSIIEVHDGRLWVAPNKPDPSPLMGKEPANSRSCSWFRIASILPRP
jgi:signal transduction histidine kinase